MDVATSTILFDIVELDKAELALAALPCAFDLAKVATEMASSSPAKATAEFNDALSREVRHLQTRLAILGPLAERGRIVDKIAAELKQTKYNRVPKLERQLADANKRAEESEQRAQVFKKRAEDNEQRLAIELPTERANVHLAQLSALENRIRAREAHVESILIREKNIPLHTLLSQERCKLSDIARDLDGLVGMYNSLKQEYEEEVSAARTQLEDLKAAAQEQGKGGPSRASELEVLNQRVEESEAKIGKFVEDDEASKRKIKELERKLDESNKDVVVWKSKADSADKKLAASLQEAHAAVVTKGVQRAGLQTGIGNIFSPAPLAGDTALGVPVVGTRVEDVASESRSRFTDTLPSVPVEPVPLSAPLDGDEDDDEILQKSPTKLKTRTRRRRTVSVKEHKRDSGPLKKRPRGRPRWREQDEMHQSENEQVEQREGVNGNDQADSDEERSRTQDTENDTEEDLKDMYSPAMRGAAKRKSFEHPRKKQKESVPASKDAPARRGRGRPRKDMTENASRTTKPSGEGRGRGRPPKPLGGGTHRIAEVAAPAREVGRSGRSRKRVSYNYDRGSDISHEFDR